MPTNMLQLIVLSLIFLSLPHSSISFFPFHLCVCVYVAKYFSIVHLFIIGGRPALMASWLSDSLAC